MINNYNLILTSSCKRWHQYTDITERIASLLQYAFPESDLDTADTVPYTAHTNDNADEEENDHVLSYDTAAFDDQSDAEFEDGFYDDEC